MGKFGGVLFCNSGAQISRSAIYFVHTETSIDI